MGIISGELFVRIDFSPRETRKKEKEEEAFFFLF